MTSREQRCSRRSTAAADCAAAKEGEAPKAAAPVQMDYCSLDTGTLCASVNISRFRGESGVDEYHLVVRPTEYASIDAQLEWVHRAYTSALAELGLDMQTALLRRFFCSDLSNPTASRKVRAISGPFQSNEPCAASWVRQPPLPPANVALWAYHVSDRGCKADKIQEGASLTFRRGGLSHHWTTGITCPSAETSYDQTHGILERYEAYLQAQGLSLADNVIRTWFFVQNIDGNYDGMVTARRECFAERGLTQDTHFIASTGIEGACANPAAKVTMDAYAISGVQPEQVEFLAADQLSPTHVYGVTFERGTSVAYRDRKHVIISGTASIDHHGNILHAGDVRRQLDRTLDNIQALLRQAGAALKDMCVFIVYVRDPGDHEVVQQQMRDRFGDAPIQVAVAPVCRRDWLVEIEGQAIVPVSSPDLPAF
jgi:enamine deaminase RidA (YjgF/YER057c/UK114 family)